MLEAIDSCVPGQQPRVGWVVMAFGMRKARCFLGDIGLTGTYTQKFICTEKPRLGSKRDSRCLGGLSVAQWHVVCRPVFYCQ